MCVDTLKNHTPNIAGNKVKNSVTTYCRSIDSCSEKGREQINEKLTILNSRLVGIAKLVKKRIVWCNSEFARLLGFLPVELEGQLTKNIFQNEREHESFWLNANDVMSQGKVFRLQVQLKPKAGTLEWYEISGERLQSHHDEAIWALTNITEHKRQEEKIQQLAFFDALTNLPNRRMLYDRLDQALSSSKRSLQFGALIMLDLDNFKLVNDTSGHHAGDRLLKEVGRRLRKNTRNNDTVSRIGGDEFILLITLLGTDMVNAKISAEIIAEKLRRVLEKPNKNNFKSDDRDWQSITKDWCTASIGVVMFPQDKANCADYIKWADEAMYTVKKKGGNGVAFYDFSKQLIVETT